MVLFFTPLCVPVNSSGLSLSGFPSQSTSPFLGNSLHGVKKLLKNILEDGKGRFFFIFLDVKNEIKTMPEVVLTLRIPSIPEQGWC